MKKRILAIFAALILATGCTSVAGAATTFTDLVDFIGEQDDVNGVDYEFVVATNTFSYNHVLTGLQTPPLKLLSGNLLLSHMGVSVNTAAEVWLAHTGNEQKYYIGTLAPSPSYDAWVLDPLSLPSEILRQMEENIPWTLLISLEEATAGADKIRLDYSQLTVEYAAVPVPGSLILLASGIVALTALRGRKKD